MTFASGRGVLVTMTAVLLPDAMEGKATIPGVLVDVSDAGQRLSFGVPCARLTAFIAELNKMSDQAWRAAAKGGAPDNLIGYGHAQKVSP